MLKQATINKQHKDLNPNDAPKTQFKIVVMFLESCQLKIVEKKFV